MANNVADTGMGPSNAVTSGLSGASEKLDQFANGVGKTADSVDRVSASAERAAGAIGMVSEAVKAVFSAFEGAGKLGVAAFAGVVAAIGSTAYAVLNLSKLISAITNIPLPIVAAGMSLIGAAAVAAYVPMWMLTGAASAVAGGFGILAGAATTAGAAIWAALTPIIAVLSPILLPVLAIAAALYTVYEVFTNWQNIPTWLKMALPILYLIKFNVEAIATAFRVAWAAVKLLWDAITLPARLAVGAIRMVTGAVATIPGIVTGVIQAIPGVLSAAGSAIQTTARAAWTASKWLAAEIVTVTKSAVAALGAGLQWAAALPGRAFNALQGTLRTLSGWATQAGQSLGGMIAPVLGFFTGAASTFNLHGQQVKDIAAQYGMASEDAAVFAFVAAKTGQAVEDLVQTMPAGSTAFAAWKREAASFGELIGGPVTEGTDALTKAQERLQWAWTGLKVQIGSAIAPILDAAAKATAEWTETLVGAVKIAIKWVSEHKPLIETAFKVATAIAGAASVLVTLGTVLGTTATFLGPIVATVAAAAAGFTLWKSGVSGLAQALAQDAWSRYGAQIRSVWGTAVEYFTKIRDFTESTLAGIRNAIQGGNLELAVNIAWTAAKVAWIAGLLEISKLTDGTLGAILKSLAAGNWSDAADAASAAVQIAWLEATGVVSRAWDGVRDGFDAAGVAIQKVWNTTIEVIEGGIRRAVVSLSNFLNWMAQNSGKIGVGAAAAARMSGVGLVESAAIGVAAQQAAQQAGEASIALNAMALTPTTSAATANAELDKGLQGRRSEREARAADADIGRQMEITTLRAQIEMAGARGDRDGQTALNKRLQELTAAQAEAARLAAEQKRVQAQQQLAQQTAQIEPTLAASQQKANRQTSGTFSAAAAMMMFGGQLGKDDVQQQQLIEQRRIAVETRRTADITDRWQRRFLATYRYT